MRVKLDYKQPPQVAGQPKNPSSQQLTLMYIQYAVKAKFPTLKGQLMRIWGRIQRKLDEAVNENLDTIELEAAEIDFLRKCINDETQFPSEVSKFVVVLQDEIEQLKIK